MQHAACSMQVPANRGDARSRLILRTSAPQDLVLTGSAISTDRRASIPSCIDRLPSEYKELCFYFLLPSRRVLAETEHPIERCLHMVMGECNTAVEGCQGEFQNTRAV
nr:hypothetical protein CFP56_62690 [Quercus suber]